MKLLKVILILFILALAVGCTPGDVNDTVYFRQIGDSTDAGKVDVGYFHELYVDGDTLYIGGIKVDGNGGEGGGAVWFSGDGTPSESVGSSGDYYLDNLSGDYYEKLNTKSMFNWTLQGNLKGAQGIQGLPGLKGDKGDAGANANITAHESTYNHSLLHSHSNSSILNQITEAFTTALKASYDSAVAAMHSHSNKSVLDAITEAFTTSLKSSYDNAVSLAHSNANDPTADQKAALAGTSGTPSASNKYVTNADSRLTDTRTPTAHNQAWSTITVTPTTLSGYGITDANNITTSTTTNGTGFLKGNSSTISFDNSTYLTGNQSISLSGDLSGSGTTSISGTVTGIQGKGVTLATGFLKYSGSAWTFDNSTYLTSYTETDPVVKAINGIVKSNGLTISAATSGTDYSLLGYTLTAACASQSTTTDSQTMYWGGMSSAVPSTTANRWRIYIPKTGTIEAVYIYSYSGTAGSNENWSMYIRYDNTTDTLVQTLGANTNDRTWSSTSLSIAVVQGHYIEIKEIQPAWGTNPATVTRTAVIYIRG